MSWSQVIPQPHSGPRTAIPEWLTLVEGLGLGLVPGLELEVRPRAVTRLGMEEEQQSTGQEVPEHRSRVGRAGPGAELLSLSVTEEARGCVSLGQGKPPHTSALHSHPNTHPGVRRAGCLAAQWEQGPVGAE